MFKKAKENKKGFTLAELLIVVAIIAVLVAISIPIFTGQLNKAREATDAANIRAAYAEAAAASLENDGAETTKTSKAMTGTRNSWTYVTEKIGGQSLPAVTKGQVVEVKVATDGTVTLTPKAAPANGQ